MLDISLCGPVEQFCNWRNSAFDAAKPAIGAPESFPTVVIVLTDRLGGAGPVPPMKRVCSKTICAPLFMVLVALFLRLVYSAVAHTYQFDGRWSGFEMANLGRSLATGHGFSSPYEVDTGPSALTGPIYPCVVSLAFEIFGVFSDGAGFAIVFFNSVFSALTCWTVHRIARRIFSEEVAVWSGWAWALSPYAIYYSVRWVWETSLSAFLLSLLFLLTLQMEDDNCLWSWLRYGVLWGLVGLINTALLAWLPFSGCWLAYRLYRAGKSFVLPALLSAVVFWGVLTPWLVRNYQVFGRVVFIRDNFGNEFRSGNNPQARGWKVGTYDALRNPILARLAKKIGEPAVNAEQSKEAKEWIAENPGLFLKLCFSRFYYFWAGLPVTWSGQSLPRSKQLKNLLFLACSLVSFGGLFLAIKRHVHGMFLFVTLVAFYPLTYYISVPEPRYRHAIEPVLLILATFLMWSTYCRGSRALASRSSRTA